MRQYVRPKNEVADIFCKYGPAYRESHKLPLQSLKVMSSIENCRTGALGGHVDKCNNCGQERNSYNSCRNRHCPKCQGLEQMKWLDKREQELLPIRYFHLVFTMPVELNPLTLVNQKEMYGILFKAASQTISMLSGQEKHLGAKPGCIAVLHTWGQNLMDHPHIHMIVTGGGLSLDGKKWINSGKKFFLPVKVMSKVFRGKFLAFLKEAYHDHKLLFEGMVKAIKQENEFKKLLDVLYEKQWIVYAKKPFGNAARVLKYLGRYTHRIAISNHRIESIEDNKVCFKWKDYSDKNKVKTMDLQPEEFIRRFLLHVLPNGFFKIRYYGLLSSRVKKAKLELCCKLLGAKFLLVKNVKLNWQELLLKLTGFDVNKCPYCKNGQMIVVKAINSRAAPWM